MNQIFKNKIWKKNWSGNWGLLFGSSYGDIYTRGLRELVGTNFIHNLIVFESGTSSNYLLQDELENYCARVISLIKKDETLPHKWCEQIIVDADKIFSLMRQLARKKDFIESDFTELQEAKLAVTVRVFSIKKVIDFLPPDLVEKYLPLFTEARLYVEPIYNETDSLLNKIAGSILAGQLSAKAIQVLSKEELADYFRTHKTPDQQKLEKRFNGCALLYDEAGTATLYEGNEFKDIMAAITAHSAGQQIKGMTAYPGKATGIVRVVLDPASVMVFNEGDILVAGMTRPEYLNLMKKSGAFITDAGGLLCHAAIVAREYKKPCIIGTEVATKVFKDGDMVEVDAEKGIVRKIN